MNDVIWARTRHHYEQYDDMFRLAELAGYPIVYLDQVPWHEPITVISSPHQGEYLGIPKDRRARHILWNIERPTPGTDYSHRDAKDMPYGVDCVWVSDAAMARHTGAKYVFLGSHPDFAPLEVIHREYDVIHLMGTWGRRSGIPSQLEGLAQADLMGGTWGTARHERLTKSKLMLSAHQDDMCWIEPPRYMIAGSYALALIAERSENSGHWCDGEHFIAADIDQLGATARALLKDEVRIARLGAAAWRLVMVQHPFKREVEAAL